MTNSRTPEKGLTWHVFAIARLESTLWLTWVAVSDLGGAESMDTAMSTPHTRIAAMSGFTPRMFMTRVRL
jgi:hypothetical protein